MNRDFEKDLNIEGDYMEDVRATLNEGIQSTLKAMIQKQALAGSTTLKINFEIVEEYIGDRKASHLDHNYKVTSSITMKGEVKGEKENHEDELEFVDDKWILMPSTGRGQRTVLDEA